MPRTKEKKRELIEELEERAKRQKAMVFVNFKGLKMNDFSELREELKKDDSEMVVLKKSLMKIAFQKKGIEVDIKNLKDEIAVVFGFSNKANPIKSVYEFSKKIPNLKIAGGFIEGIMRTESDMVQLAKLPSREELLGNLIGTLQAPMSNFVNVLQGNLKGLVYVLNRLKR